MSPEEAAEILSASTPIDIGKFYGSKKNLSLGAGLIYERILSPIFSEEEKIFLTARRAVYVLTHECDVDPANRRPFNDFVCFCPVITIEGFLKRSGEQWPDPQKLKSFLSNVARREVGRLTYIPPGPGILQYGGLIYLNNIDSTHVSSFNDQQPIAALSEYGLREIDSALKNSLLRPKDEFLTMYQGSHTRH